jgi:hypothetical protein
VAALGWEIWRDFCDLDCPDDVLAARLRARPSWRLSSLETVRHRLAAVCSGDDA